MNVECESRSKIAVEYVENSAFEEEQFPWMVIISTPSKKTQNNINEICMCFFVLSKLLSAIC